MKLEKYKDKKETKRKVMLIGLTAITLVSIAMMLYKTFANFRTTTSFTIMSGKVVYKKKGKELGKDILPNGGNGLYEVPHSEPVGWTQTEYRYAGSNPNNYVYFNCDNGKEENSKNCELWRIIGLVNVKTAENKIDQRLKIIRSDSIGNYAWDKDSNYTNDWTRSSLKDMLNDGYYYQSPEVPCYTGPNKYESSQNSCSFNSNPKGLTSLARDMIDNQIIWNLGGWNEANVTTDKMYTYERGTTKYGSNSIEWSKTTDSTGYRGVGLMYPSDYGYAVGGNVRAECLNLTLFNFSTKSCGNYDWLNMNGNSQWSLTHHTTWNSNAFFVNTQGNISNTFTTSTPAAVRPVVYVSAGVGLIDGDGSRDKPFKLLE